LLATLPKSFVCRTILDYGIADGGQFLELGLNAEKVIGIDTSSHMIDLSREKFAGLDFAGYVGSVEVIRQIDKDTVDLVLCINVLGYLTENEQELFFKETYRILRSGGFLVIMTGNELFDLFALNAGTADFFLRNFSQPFASRLLVESKSERFKNADRRNPLKFAVELEKFGFAEIAQTFSQWHKKIPAIANIEAGGDLIAAYEASRDHDLNPNSLPDVEKWKRFFCCSTFASLSRKR
jgi:SAM-dependent methyltransferase